MRNTLLFTFLLILTAANASAKNIAITFDDAPLSGSSLMSGTEKTEKIIIGLKSRKIEGALFFVTTRNISDEAAHNRLQRYVEEGFQIANHSHSHQSSQKLTPKKYLSDFYTSHLITKDFDGLIKLHRFPYLHQPHDEESRAQIFKGISNLGYDYGYITVDNYDWHLNSRLVKAHKEGLRLNLENMKRLYLDTILGAMEFYDDLAEDSLGRSPDHILLLHENEIAALFIGDLIDHIRSKGWNIISPTRAYQDPIAKMYSPKLEFTNQGRVAAIAYSKGATKSDLRHPAESKEYLDKKLIEYDVFIND